MGVGKIATQVAHASVLSADKSRQSDYLTFNKWFESGQAKVVLKVRNFQDLVALQKSAENLSLLVVFVEDNGPAQINPGVWSCICIGPAPSILVDKVTRHLKLL